MVKLLILISVVGVFHSSCAKPERFLNRGLFGKAEQYCYSLAGQKQKDCFLKVGKALFEDQKFIHASNLYKKAGSLEMENKCYLAMAQHAVKAGNFDHAGKWYLKARNKKLARQYYEKEAQKLAKEGKLRKASRLFQKAGNQEKFRETVLKAGKKMEKKNNFHAALHYYKSAGIEMKPIYKRFARHYLKHGRIHESMKCFVGAGVEPKQYYKIIGEYFLLERNFNKALSYFLKAGIPKKKSFELIAQSALRRNIRSTAETYYGYSGMSDHDIQLKLAEYYRARNQFDLAGDYFLRARERDKAVSMFQKVLKKSKNQKKASYALIKLVKLQDRQTIANLEKHTRSDNPRLAGAASLYSKIAKKKLLKTAILVYPPVGRKMNSKRWKHIIKLPRVDPGRIIEKIAVLARGKKEYFKIKPEKKKLHVLKFFHQDSKWLKKTRDTGKYDLIIETYIKKDLVPPPSISQNNNQTQTPLQKQRKQRKLGNGKYYGKNIRADYLQLVKVHIPSLFITKSFQTRLGYKECPFLKKKDLSKLQNNIRAQWKNKSKILQHQLLNLLKDIFNIKIID